jgi:hypothetical protein
VDADTPSNYRVQLDAPKSATINVRMAPACENDHILWSAVTADEEGSTHQVTFLEEDAGVYRACGFRENLTLVALCSRWGRREYRFDSVADGDELDLLLAPPVFCRVSIVDSQGGKLYVDTEAWDSLSLLDSSGVDQAIGFQLSDMSDDYTSAHTVVVWARASGLFEFGLDDGPFAGRCVGTVEASEEGQSIVIRIQN